LAHLGFTWNFAPVLDVDSNPENPIIGDRSFSRDPSVVAQHALAYIEGIQEQGIAACGKHFPGHGDTALDSHIALPTVAQSRERLEQIELAPFRACARSSLAGMMTAHVTYPSLDPTGTPATFSSAILDGLLRKQLGFAGVVFSDDLEMGAIAQHHDIESAICRAILAGCDALLICHDETLANRALEALEREARTSEFMQERIRRSAARLLAARSAYQPPLADKLAPCPEPLSATYR
jgi:beta-N-acetylhexosaminidase